MADVRRSKKNFLAPGMEGSQSVEDSRTSRVVHQLQANIEDLYRQLSEIESAQAAGSVQEFDASEILSRLRKAEEEIRWLKRRRSGEDARPRFYRVTNTLPSVVGSVSNGDIAYRSSDDTVHILINSVWQQVDVVYNKNGNRCYHKLSGICLSHFV